MSVMAPQVHLCATGIHTNFSLPFTVKLSCSVRGSVNGAELHACYLHLLLLAQTAGVLEVSRLFEYRNAGPAQSVARVTAYICVGVKYLPWGYQCVTVALVEV